MTPERLRKGGGGYGERAIRSRRALFAKLRQVLLQTFREATRSAPSCVSAIPS